MNIEHFERLIEKNTRLIRACENALVVVFIFAIVVLMLALTSCSSTKYIPVQTIRTDTVYKNRKDSVRFETRCLFRDSIRMHDSIVLRTDATGKTIEKDTWHWRDRYHSELDSTAYYKAVLDSVLNHQQKVQIKPVKVTKTLSEKYPFKKKFIGLAWSLLIGIVLGTFHKSLYHFFKKLLKVNT